MRRMTLFALYFKYLEDPRGVICVRSDFVVNSFWHGPSLWSFSDSLWLLWSVCSPLMNRDGAISMSKGLYGMVWVSIQEHNSNATVCHVNYHGLVLFEILEGASLFLCDVISRWLGLLDTGSNSSPEVLDPLCISCSDFWRNLGEYDMAEMLAGVPTSQTVLHKRPSQHRWGCLVKLDNLVFSVSRSQFSLRNIDRFHSE